MKWLREGSPAVNNARFDPGVILPRAGEVRVQILGLAPEGNVLVVPVVSTPSQRHREAVKCQIAPRGMLPSKQHLRERRDLSIRSVADAWSEQIVDVVERGARGFLANAKVTDCSKPVVQVIGQIGPEAVAARTTRIQVQVFVTTKQLSSWPFLGHGRSCNERGQQHESEEIAHFSSCVDLAGGHGMIQGIAGGRNLSITQLS